MNALALFLFIAGVAQLPAALAIGGHNGLTILGCTLIITAGIIQHYRPRKAQR